MIGASPSAVECYTPSSFCSCKLRVLC